MEMEYDQLNKEILRKSEMVMQPNLEAPWPLGHAVREQIVILSEEDKGKIKVKIKIKLTITSHHNI